MSKRFVSWIAVSSLPQAKKISLDDQLKTNREHVARWDGVMVAELAVPGESRSIVLFEDACRRIEAYAQLRDLIEQRAFDVLIFLDRSRLGRVAALSMTLVELCHQAGIIAYATESPPSSLEGTQANFATRILGAVESVTAQEEVKKLVRRHDMGMTARVMRGDFPGRIPYGWLARYDMENDKPVKTIEVDEEAATIIRHIFDLYLNHGMGLNNLSLYLKERGYPPPRDGQWGKSSIVSLFDSVWRYAGFVELNRHRKSKREYIRVKSRWPAIITEWVAKAIVEERRQRSMGRRAVGTIHRFSRAVFCGQCNRRLTALLRQSFNARHPEIEYVSYEYRCRDAGRSRHPKSTIAAKYITAAVREAVEFVQVQANREQILSQPKTRMADVQRDIERAKVQLAKHQQAVRRIDDAYTDGSMDATRYQRQVNRLLAQRVELEGELARLNDKVEADLHEMQREQRLIEIATNGIAMLESDDVPTANAWFRRHIKIWVHNDQRSRVNVEYL